MTRIKKGVQARANHKKILQKVKGYYGSRSRVYKVGNQSIIKSKQYAYISRKFKKRNIKLAAIISINFNVRLSGVTYSNFSMLLKKSNILLNKKILATFCVHNNQIFKLLIFNLKNFI